MKEEDIEELNMNTMLFFTGIQRNASDILTKQDKSTKDGSTDILNRLDSIKEIIDEELN